MNRRGFLVASVVAPLARLSTAPKVSVDVTGDRPLIDGKVALTREQVVNRKADVEATLARCLGTRIQGPRIILDPPVFLNNEPIVGRLVK